METQAVEMIREMMELSQQGKLRWAKLDFDMYEANLAERRFQVEFIYFARTDETGSDRTMARLTAFGILYDYCIGTEGFDLICEMLAFSDPNWIEWRKRTQGLYAEGLRFLRDWKDSGTE